MSCGRSYLVRVIPCVTLLTLALPGGLLATVAQEGEIERENVVSETLDSTTEQIADPIDATQPGSAIPGDLPPTLPEPLLAGPMLGPAELADARIWLQTRYPARIQLRFWPQDAPERSRVSDEIPTTAAEDHIALFDLTDLEYGTVYRYEVYADGVLLDLPWARTFETQDHWRWRHDPPPIRIAVGSCAYINDPPADRPGTPYGSDFHIFDTIAQSDPDLMLWIGDNIYLREPDFWSRASIRRRHRQNRSLPELQRLLAATRHYATWDDHDYGPNNSDRTYREKEAALEAFLDYFPNPGAGIPGTDGVFTRFEWGDLEIFLLDDRYHRTPANLPPEMKRQVLGPEQLTWLIEGLASSTATFKIVAMGSQVLNPRVIDESWFETFELYPQEKRRLLDALEALEVEGVLFVSGDRHHSELLRIDRGRRLYPLLELTTSSLTAGLAMPETGMEGQVPGSYTNARHNFALIEVDGPRKERRLTLRLVDDRGDEMWRYEIPAGALEVPSEVQLPGRVMLPSAGPDEATDSSVPLSSPVITPSESETSETSTTSPPAAEPTTPVGEDDIPPTVEPPPEDGSSGEA